MIYRAVEKKLPRALRRYLLFFETTIEEEVSKFAQQLPKGALVLDAGAGESKHAHYFAHQRYIGIDLAVGDVAWNYKELHAIADLSQIPFRTGSFDAAINVVTLEHLREPAEALKEIARTLKPGGQLLLIAPHEWEVHQAPHDYFRYTRHGLEYLLESAGFAGMDVQPVGGYFRLMSRRLLNGLQFFRGIAFVPAALALAPLGLLLPFFDRLDRERNFTLGYVCRAHKSG